MSVVFLCVGAAKAGTSWLHQQLAGHPECHFRAIKELHYFSAIEKGRIKYELKKHRAQQIELLERLAKSGQAPTNSQAQRLADRGAWIDVLEQLGASVLIAGPKAQDYLHGEALDKVHACGAEVQWMDYSGYPEYPQLYPPFEHAVSIVDLVFNTGPEATRYMKQL